MPDMGAFAAKFDEFRAHWQSLRGDARAASLSRFLDLPLPRLQPWIAIFDVEADFSWTARLVGTELVTLFGLEFTGKRMDEVVNVDARAALRRHQKEISQRLCGNFHLGLCSSTTGRAFEIRSMGLPLLRANGAVSAVWLMIPEMSLQKGEAGTTVLRIIAEEWLDLGNGVPEGRG